MNQQRNSLRRRMGATTLAFVMVSGLTMPFASANETPAAGEELFDEEEATQGVVPSAPLPSHDPFFALVVPKTTPKPDTGLTLPPPPLPVATPAPMPVQYSVLAIAGETAEHTAVIQYKNETYVVQAGAFVPDAQNPDFEIKDVAADKVTAWDPKVKRIVPVRLPQIAGATPGAGP